jgi:endonuclease VIII
MPYAGRVPEGDALHRAARRLQALVGQRLEVETPHPRAAVKGIAERLDGRRLEAVDAVGKNLFFRFEGGLVLRSHLRLTGRWRLERRGMRHTGKPWLVLRGDDAEGVLWNGPVLELRGDKRRRIGPDILEEPPRLDAMMANLRLDGRRELGDALLDQRLVAGIGTVWRAEALWATKLSPWIQVGSVDDDALRALLTETHEQMRAALNGARGPRRAYRRAGHGCPRCGALISSSLQGESARVVYWCPECQPAPERGTRTAP